jgi:hypothetical protein
MNKPKAFLGGLAHQQPIQMQVLSADVCSYIARFIDDAKSFRNFSLSCVAAAKGCRVCVQDKMLEYSTVFEDGFKYHWLFVEVRCFVLPNGVPWGNVTIQTHPARAGSSYVPVTFVKKAIQFGSGGKREIQNWKGLKHSRWEVNMWMHHWSDTGPDRHFCDNPKIFVMMELGKESGPVYMGEDEEVHKFRRVLKEDGVELGLVEEYGLVLEEEELDCELYQVMLEFLLECDGKDVTVDMMGSRMKEEQQRNQ